MGLFDDAFTPAPQAPKFSRERGGPGSTHGENLFWSNNDPAPFRGPAVPLLKDHEAANLERVYNFRSKMFHLEDPEDKREFDEIYDRHVNNWYKVCVRREHWNDDTHQLQIWLEWVQIYREEPTGRPAPR